MATASMMALPKRGLGEAGLFTEVLSYSTKERKVPY